MPQTRIILVGGFLGAGKTTMLARAATALVEQGKRVGLITNDQAANLVDTAILEQARLQVQEIAGGCFCCRFGQLLETAEQLVAEMSPDVIIGEPVGSCTDLSATVLQPLKDLCVDSYRLSPLSVLVDPQRLRSVLAPEHPSPMHASASYILRKQLEEADLIVINKQDTLTPAEQQQLAAATAEAFSGKPIHLCSALTGEGVAEWLEAVMADVEAGAHIVDVDYDVYAEGEAVLGWLNASATVTAATGIDWQALARKLIELIQQAAAARQAEIAHVKLSLTAEGQGVANLTSTSGTPTVRGEIEGNPVTVSLVLNARVQMSPEELRSIVEGAFAEIAGDGHDLEVETLHSLSPGRPVPTHRYASVV
ncbi:MAG: GTP-binding protein [Armatimonadia bacterium]